MAASDLEEIDLFRAVRDCGARSLPIGRRALVALGLPVATFDCDFWLQGLRASEHSVDEAEEGTR